MLDREDDFTVDADELQRVIGELSACESGLHGLADDLSREITALHSRWRGQAATAHQVAQSEWERGLLGMRESLDVLRTAAQLACDNYRSAASANLDMWSQLR